ncbi:MAG: Coq4 family protein [Proteobacteria bacterium]|nr:Coq4 family protein [Pseudomonadota bacterium]
MSIDPAPNAVPTAPRPRVRWRSAWRSLRALLNEPEDTARAVDLVLAVGGPAFERSFRRLAACPEGRRLLRARPCLATALSDREALERLPEASLGRAYLRYLDANGFSTQGLLDLNRRTRQRWEAAGELAPLDPARQWFADRLVPLHDLQHVLTGYGTDDVGEATLLAFSAAQFGGRANWLLTVGAGFEVWRALGLPWLRYERAVWRRGRGAVWLGAVAWEEWLPLDLERVREQTRVGLPREAHPEGVLRGTIDDAYTFVPA